MKTKRILTIALLLLLTGQIRAADLKENTTSNTGKFWTRRTVVEYSAMNIMLASDGYWTNFNNNKYSHEQDPFARPFVKNTKNISIFMAVQSAGMLGLSYVFHRTGHTKLEHVVFYAQIVGNTYGTTYCITHR